jgi:Uma2 family endonuclease
MSTDFFSNTARIGEPEIVLPQDLLRSGDRMTREEFHRLYEQTPKHFKAELIGRIVYVASPVSPAHGKPDRLLSAIFAAYEGSTKGVEGVEGSCDTTVFLNIEDELQPD